MKIGTLAAALAGGTLMFLLGFLLFGVVFADYFRANMVQYPGLEKDPPIIWAIFLFNLAWGWLIAWIAERSGSKGWVSGAKVGTIVMFVLALGIDLEFHAFMNVHKAFAPMALHVLIVALMGAISGAAIGFVLQAFGRRSIASE